MVKMKSMSFLIFTLFFISLVCSLPEFDDEEERRRRAERRAAWEKEVAEHVEPEPPEVFEYKTGECFEDEGRRLCMPSFIYAGCGHCGTTSLVAYMRQHPNIEIPQKEPSWWGGPVNPRKNRWDQEAYATKLAGSRSILEHHITGDVSIRYKADPEAPFQAAKMFPDMKIIMMVREPGEQCYSTTNYNMRRWFKDHRPPKQKRNESVCIPEYLPDYTKDYENKRYSTACDQPEYSINGMRRWKEAFPDPNQFLYLQTEELASDAKSVLFKIEEFLGLDHYNEYDTSKRFNQLVLMSGQKREMRPELRILFDACFSNTSIALEEEMGMKLHYLPHEREYWYQRAGFALDWSEGADANQEKYEQKMQKVEL